MDVHGVAKTLIAAKFSKTLPSLQEDVIARTYRGGGGPLWRGYDPG
jgi:hypothetical protein